MTSELYFQIGLVLACLSMFPVGLLFIKEDASVLFFGALLFLAMWVAWPVVFPLALGCWFGNLK
jgi:hypothetical protein